MSRNIVFEGWLTKSPPTKRIWRTKWRRRWFALRQSCELPGQYFLDYYADRNCRRLKGTINLDLCEQVDAGLHMERSGTGSLDPKLRGSVFTIQTQSRTYHLEADCEAEMGKWVDAICRVCGLRSTDESSIVLETYQSIGARYQNGVSVMEDHHCEGANGTGPYIPISECITGVRAQDEQRAFTFDPKNIVRSTRVPFDRDTENRAQQMYTSQPHIRLNNTEFSENESNLSDEECSSLNASQSNIRDWPVEKSFTKLSISPNRNGVSEDGPPVPPRPPKTFAINKDAVQKETYQGPKVQEPIETQEDVFPPLQSRALEPVPRRLSYFAPPSAVVPRHTDDEDDYSTVQLPRVQIRALEPVPRRLSHLAPPPAVAPRHTDDEDDYSTVQLSMQYSNLPSLPPAVDRALKPRLSSHSIGHINHLIRPAGLQIRDEIKADKLQYLDLDLPSIPTPTKLKSIKKIDIVHGKSLSAEEEEDDDSAYKTVDFLKTEAFNITRQDAEASRSGHY